MQPLRAIICFRLLSLVFAYNTPLVQLEENLLHSHLKNRTQLEQFYEKLILSNGLDDLNHTRAKLTAEDLQRGNLQEKCFQSTDELLNAFGIANEELSRNDVNRLLPSLLYTKVSEGCQKLLGSTKWKNFIVGLICIAIINFTALFGAIILPFRKRSVFKWLLSAFIGLAVGTLVGTGIFHLIPMAFDVERFDHQLTFLNKGLLAILVIYLFYMRDQLCQLFFHVDTIVSTHTHGEAEEEEADLSPILAQTNTRSLRENLRRMKPIGWMILISDLLHGFIDGLTIGTISMISISECVRMTIPIACEDFAHKLGDAAVLLSSGLPVKQALLMNFLSSCGCYPGFLLGAKLGELENFHPWICAIAGGMFVYIGLADMVPELIAMGSEIEKDYAKANRPVTKGLKFKILLTQNLGVIGGVATMYLLARYGEHLVEQF